MKEGEDFLKGYGFVPWSAGGMQGWYRQTAFVKDCLAGEIARYYADDYIVIRHEGDRSVNWLREHWQSREDVMTHRFLLLDCHETRLTKKVFWLGIRGWLEILQYKEGDAEKRFDDLIYLAQQRRCGRIILQ